MLSLAKKSNSLPAVEPLWHPNFRNFERLPDTKIVRTTFFINTAAIAVTLGLLLWLGYREYHIRSLDDQIAVAQAEIDSNGNQNKEALRLSKIFGDEEKKLLESVNFLRAPLSPSDFVNLIGQSLPKEISIDTVEARLSDPKNQLFVLRGVVAGTRDQASGSASSYVDVLRAHPRLSTVFDPITLERLTPEGSTGFLSFEIFLKVKPEGKK
jgi:hypothetical protein